MEMFEKVEKLRERANISYEEAKEALYASDGDLLDAMVYLEKQGKVSRPGQSSYTTNSEAQEQFVSVEETVRSQEKPENVFDAIRNIIRTFIDKCRGNSLCITKDGEVKGQLPVLLGIVILCCGWELVVPAIIISLFFGVHYSFVGKDELKTANDIMDQASTLAEQMKESFMGKDER